MGKILDLREIPDLPQEITQAALNGELVLFVGAGASMLVGLPSWGQLALSVFEELRNGGFLNYSEIEQLKSLEPKKQLSIAELIAEENGYVLELRKYLNDKEGNSGIFEYLNQIGCVCVTTNYDELLNPRFLQTNDGSTTTSPVLRISDKNEFHASYLNQPGTVIHLHGFVCKPETMVVTTKQYLEHYDNDTVKHFLGELFEKKTILFIGYGLEEAEILEHILRRGNVRDTQIKTRFALQGFFQSQDPLYRKLYNYYQKSFGVHLIGFIRDHNNYNQLEIISKTWAEQIEVKPPALAVDIDFMDEVLG